MFDSITKPTKDINNRLKDVPVFIRLFIVSLFFIGWLLLVTIVGILSIFFTDEPARSNDDESLLNDEIYSSDIKHFTNTNNVFWADD